MKRAIKKIEVKKNMDLERAKKIVRQFGKIVNPVNRVELLVILAEQQAASFRGCKVTVESKKAKKRRG